MKISSSAHEFLHSESWSLTLPFVLVQVTSEQQKFFDIHSYVSPTALKAEMAPSMAEGNIDPTFKVKHKQKQHK